MRRTTFFILFDILFIALSTLLMLWILPGDIFPLKERNVFPALVFMLIWVITSFIFKKYSYKIKPGDHKFYWRILWINSVILIITCLLILMVSKQYSNELIIGTIVISTLLELLVSHLYQLSIKVIPSIEVDTIGENSYSQREDIDVIEQVNPDPEFVKQVCEYTDEAQQDFIFRHVVNNNLLKTLFVATTTKYNIENQNGHYQNIVNLRRINDIQRINKFFIAVNNKITKGGVFIGCVETDSLRKQRILQKYPCCINYVYYSLDFILKRIFPKLALTKGIYYFLTRGNNRVLSKAETFGRLYSCGFELLDERFSSGLLYFAARKVQDPICSGQTNDGPFIKLRRIGKNGKAFNVLKLRTMHPYAEYLQAYVHNKNNLQKGGKFKNDFRITTLGRFFRKFWIDEIPMIANVLRGDMKIVGVRPLSKHYFNLYKEGLKQKRIKFKPGLLPPYYVDMPETLDEIQASEMKYLERYEKKPFCTDFQYFWKILYSILIKKKRSK